MSRTISSSFPSLIYERFIFEVRSIKTLLVLTSIVSIIAQTPPTADFSGVQTSAASFVILKNVLTISATTSTLLGPLSGTCGDRARDVDLGVGELLFARPICNHFFTVSRIDDRIVEVAMEYLGRVDDKEAKTCTHRILDQGTLRTRGASRTAWGFNRGKRCTTAFGMSY